MSRVRSPSPAPIFQSLSTYAIPAVCAVVFNGEGLMGLVAIVEFGCKNPDCARQVPILLPDPTREGKYKRQPWTPRLAFEDQRIVACPICGQANIYRTADYHPKRVVKEDLSPDRYGTVPIVASRPCGTENCATHIEIWSLIPNGMQVTEL